MSVRELLTTMEKLKKMHKSLLELAYKKTEYVKNGNMAELDDVTKQEQSHVAAIMTLEQQRQNLVTKYLEEKGVILSAPPTVADVIDIVETEEERQQLQQMRNQLLLIINDLQVQNELNQKLVFQSLQLVNLSLDLLRPHPDQINYSRKNQLEKVSQRNSLFDSQA